uniref:thymidylate synthase n=1 Tax=viral metagenome TaxID=1070528 RepID=A0A6C0CEZ8_9ZZZZ
MATNINEYEYLKLLNIVRNEGICKKTRNGNTYSYFGYLLKFDIHNSFPLLTTKKVFFKGVVEELLWFLKGSVNSKELEEKGVNIWKGNSSREYLDANGFTNYEEGYLGPIYGFQWRSFNGKIDQLRYLLEEMNKENSRRIILNAWNPCQLNEQALPPCHLLYNFYKGNNNDISCMMYMRSSDLFLGLPFNIASTALFTYIIAKVCGYNLREIALSLCDCHIYEEHLEAVDIQLNRTPTLFPQIKINKDIDINIPIDEKIKWIEELKFEDFELINYNPQPTIKAPMK